MSPNFQIINGRSHHCGRIARQLRGEHHASLLQLGLSVHRQIRDNFDQSYFKKAWLIDGRLAGLGGVIGSELSATGFIWLALTDEATKYSKEIVREARRQLDAIMLTKTELATTIVDGDDAAMRFAMFMGFCVGLDWMGGPAASLHGRRRMARYIRQTPEIRQPYGQGMAYSMGYFGAPQ